MTLICLKNIFFVNINKSIFTLIKKLCLKNLGNLTLIFCSYFTIYCQNHIKFPYNFEVKIYHYIQKITSYKTTVARPYEQTRKRNFAI